MSRHRPPGSVPAARLRIPVVSRRVFLKLDCSTARRSSHFLYKSFFFVQGRRCIRTSQLDMSLACRGRFASGRPARACISTICCEETRFPVSRESTTLRGRIPRTACKKSPLSSSARKSCNRSKIAPNLAQAKSRWPGITVVAISLVR